MEDDGINYIQRLIVVPPNQIEAVQTAIQHVGCGAGQLTSVKPIRPPIFQFTVSAPEGHREREEDDKEVIEDGNIDADVIVEYEPTNPGDDEKAVVLVRVVEMNSKDEQNLL